MLRGSTSWRPTMPSEACASSASTRTCRTRPRKSPTTCASTASRFRCSTIRRTSWPMQFGAVRTPEVFVLDANRTVRYHGRIDGQYLPGVQKTEQPALATWRSRSTNCWPASEVSEPEVEAVGCFIGRRAQADRRRGHLFEADRPHLSEPLRRMPSPGRDRSLLADQLRRGASAGAKRFAKWSTRDACRLGSPIRRSAISTTTPA